MGKSLVNPPLLSKKCLSTSGVQAGPVIHSPFHDQGGQPRADLLQEMKAVDTSRRQRLPHPQTAAFHSMLTDIHNESGNILMELFSL